MTELYRIGPFDKHRAPKFDGYSESRRASFVEYCFQSSGVPLSFAGELRYLSQLFDTPKIEVLEGGCGNAVTLKDIKEKGQSIGLDVQTTGITWAQRNASPALSNGVDTLVVGRVERYFAQFGDSKRVHMIIDAAGALQYDEVNRGDRTLTGTKIIPIYSALLHPGGKAILTIGGQVIICQKDGRGRVYEGETSEEIMQRLQENGLRVVQHSKGYVIAEKM
jgi:hypothetical protein